MFGANSGQDEGHASSQGATQEGIDSKGFSPIFDQEAGRELHWQGSNQTEAWANHKKLGLIIGEFALNINIGLTFSEK